MKTKLLLTSIAGLALSCFTFAQQSQNEVPQDAYIPGSTENRQTSPAYQFTGSHFFFTQVSGIL